MDIQQLLRPLGWASIHAKCQRGDRVSHDSDLVQIGHLNGSQLQNRLLDELDDLLLEIEDGIVKESTFTGCIALGHNSLPPLNESQSRRIKEILYCEPDIANQLAEVRPPILNMVLEFIRGLWTSDDRESANSGRDGTESTLLLLDQYGRVKPSGEILDYSGRSDGREEQDVQEADVERFFSSCGDNCAWAIPYSWDIANRLRMVKQAEADGDLALFFERRRKLNVQRPKATRFEQSVQRYTARVSELYSDEKGNITDKPSLQALVNELVDRLLKASRIYWPMVPLLAIFDGLVATVLRPLLHRHRTVYFQSETISQTGVIVSGSATAKAEQLVTTPKWNEEAQKEVVDCVKKALKAHIWSLFMDRYAPFNREYSKSPHLNGATLTDVGLQIRGFGDPVHIGKVMELLQPTNEADELANYVSDHFRSDDIIDH